MAVAITYTDAARLGNAASPQTFSGKAIGTATSDRLVFVGVAPESGGRSFSSVTIGGITATAAVTQTAGNFQNAAGTSTNAVYWANVPTGTAADIVVSFTGGNSAVDIIVYAVAGADTTTPVDSSGTDTDLLDVDLTVTKTVQANGGAIGFAFGSIAHGSCTYTWTNATEDIDTANQGSGASYITASTQTDRVFTADPSGITAGEDMLLVTIVAAAAADTLFAQACM